eukprot:TRINITY_DN406_c1_g1_i1.p1 TRINITY_DN406_c1_g1~~TRINITY_DN406_c1_g1_i1.p1  ORF type:complete len:211 (+),score=65.05 TRINITY_DN406_c1_g1_i1:69-635(+)
MFAEHLAECRTLADQASDELDRLKTAPESERPGISAAVFTLLKQADDSLVSLQQMAKSVPAGERASLAKEEATLRQELKAKATELEEARRELLLGSSGGNTEKLFLAREERRKATAVTQSLQRSTNQLKDGNRMMAESEEVGVQALQELRKQREQILRAKDNTNGLGENMGEAERAVKELEKPACAMM